MREIFYSDMDGTLLRNDATMSQDGLERLKKMVKEGLPFSVATGRSLPNIKSMLGDIELTLPVIENNGVFLTDYKTGEKLVINSFPHEHYKEVIDRFMNHEDSILINGFDGDDILYVWEEHLNIGTRVYLEYLKRANLQRIEMVKDPRTLDPKMIVNVQMVAKRKKIESIVETVADLKDELDVHAMSSYLGWWYVSMANPKSTKAHGLEQVRERVGEGTYYVFGDNVNDLTLFQAADKKIAVSNAIKELKQVADEVIESNEEDSVIRYVERKWYANKK